MVKTQTRTAKLTTYTVRAFCPKCFDYSFKQTTVSTKPKKHDKLDVQCQTCMVELEVSDIYDIHKK